MAENYRVTGLRTTKKRQALALSVKHARSTPLVSACNRFCDGIVMVDLPARATPPPPLSAAEKRRAWLDMTFVDHGFLRAIYGHVHMVDGQLARAAQPAPARLAWAKDKGFKSVLNLRGARPTCGAYILQRQACHDLNLPLIAFPIRSRGALDRETLHAACTVFEQLEYPVFMHCKSGADRTGFMATLYLHLVRGQPLETARRHLSLRYGHVRQAKTGVIDYFFDRYQSHGAAQGLTLPEWIDNGYDKQALDQGFRENWFAGLLVNKILRRE